MSAWESVYCVKMRLQDRCERLKEHMKYVNNNECETSAVQMSAIDNWKFSIVQKENTFEYSEYVAPPLYCESVVLIDCMYQTLLRETEIGIRFFYETFDTFKFFPVVLAVAAKNNNFVIPLWSHYDYVLPKLKVIFQNPNITKIIHKAKHASYVILRHFDSVLVNAIDTKMVQWFINEKLTKYADCTFSELAKSYCDVVLDELQPRALRGLHLDYSAQRIMAKSSRLLLCIWGAMRIKVRQRNAHDFYNLFDFLESSECKVRYKVLKALENSTNASFLLLKTVEAKLGKSLSSDELKKLLLFDSLRTQIAKDNDYRVDAVATNMTLSELMSVHSPITLDFFVHSVNLSQIARNHASSFVDIVNGKTFLHSSTRGEESYTTIESDSEESNVDLNNNSTHSQSELLLAANNHVYNTIPSQSVSMLEASSTVNTNHSNTQGVMPVELNNSSQCEPNFRVQVNVQSNQRMIVAVQGNNAVRFRCNKCGIVGHKKKDCTNERVVRGGKFCESKRKKQNLKRLERRNRGNELKS